MSSRFHCSLNNGHRVAKQGCQALYGRDGAWQREKNFDATSRGLEQDKVSKDRSS